MVLENIMLSKISKRERRQEPYDFTHMWDIKLKLIDTGNSMVAIKRERCGGREKRVKGGQIFDDGRRLDFRW